MTRTLPFPRLLWALLLLPGVSCRSAPTTPKGVYRAVVADLSSATGGGLRSETLARQGERYELLLEWDEEGALTTASEYLFAALALTTSDDQHHLIRARELAIRAAELGDERGFTVQAHAIDRLLVTQRKRYQRYGTEYVYNPILKRFHLYPVDPTTTDAIRRSMGVRSLAELLAEVDALNDSEITRRLRGEVELFGGSSADETP